MNAASKSAKQQPLLHTLRGLTKDLRPVKPKKLFGNFLKRQETISFNFSVKLML
jgi:hypothetical protein